MKKSLIATANAAAITTAIIYIFCAAAFIIAPELSMNIARSWFHGIDITSIGLKTITIDSLLIGIITATAGMWFVGYIFALFYNKFAKK